jgi:serine/threonine-protein kinase HipA
MTTQPDELVVLLDGAKIGAVTQRDGALRFVYDDGWRRSPVATPLSLSMPLVAEVHADELVRPFLWGLLPDNEAVLERWGRDHQVSPRNPFALLRHVGEDCAGAVQLVTPDRVDALLAGEGGVAWITDDQVGARLAALRRDPTAWHVAGTGQFSLAGAQAKTALRHDPATDRWGIPWGAEPTSHILKPAVAGFEAHDLNEHLCLAAARRLGMAAARSAVVDFGGERAIVIERYDRSTDAAGRLRRIHQEDACQALAVAPDRKYENEGGPSAERVASLLRSAVRPREAADLEVTRLVDALAFNWLIAGTDAHAKNYAVLLTGRTVRLAPLYDVASALPYPELYRPKLRLAMRVGGEYRIDRVRARHWRRVAGACGLDPATVLDRIDDLAQRAPRAFAEIVGEPDVQALGGELPGRLVDEVTAHADRCRHALRDDGS